MLEFCKKQIYAHYNFLLFFLVILFIFRPFTDNIFYSDTWKILFTATLLSAIFNCKHAKSIKVVEIGLAIPIIFLCWFDVWNRQLIILIANTILSILFIFLCTSSIVYDVLKKTRVTFETLKGVMCAYFLVAIGFAYLFWLIEIFFPGTFSTPYNQIEASSYGYYISQMIYFSFVTLLTIGFGDIVPMKDLGQTAVIIEGIIGQFYMAVLVARLVSIYTLYPQIKKSRHKS